MMRSTWAILQDILGREMTSNFKKYAEEYNPFPWEVDNRTDRTDVRGKTNVVISFKRYSKVVEYIKSGFPEIKSLSIADLGAYPGTWLKIIRDYLKISGSYCAVGLGFSDDFKNAINSLSGDYFETELDPDFKYSIEPQNIQCKDFELCLFLDTIEHLVNPIYSLDLANKMLKKNGKLIITTDNISAFGYVANMLYKGTSPNIHPIRSSLFYRGPWRPHFREYSKDELYFYLEYCGFKIIKHEYFERLQGDYYLKNDSLKLLKNNRYLSVTGMIKWIFCLIIPHLRDHQILIAEKNDDYSELIKNRFKPTEDMNIWLEYRAKHGL